MADLLISDELSDEPSDFGSLRPGTRLGRYELLVPIARGGMARVWAARQHGTRGFQKLVAIKTILPHLADEPDFEHMFLDEARIASGVHHPNVCEIYELGEEKRTLYLAMEWVNGDSFSRALRVSGTTEPVEPEIAARIIADACAGAHAAHELEDDDGRKLGVVHRDLSPHNILINADGFTKVCDFGVAKALGQLHEQTSAGQLKGKISYMSPEQVTGDPVDRRSDVFSLGCVLYEATTGKRPFRGEGDHNVMTSIVHGKFEPPSQVVRNYPPELERVIMRALASVPNRRFASAELMRYALEEFLTRGPLVTQGQVGQVIKARLAELLERRRERIKQASSSAEGWDPSSVPSSRMGEDHRSGVKPSSSGHSHRSYEPVPIGPSSSSTIPHVPSAMAALAEQAETHQDLHKLGGFPTAESSGASVIEEAILSSLVPNPLGPPTYASPSEAPPRSVMEARALTSRAPDVPIPIMSPLSTPPLSSPPASFEGPPSMYPSLVPPPPADGAEPSGMAFGHYAIAMLVGLMLALVIGGTGIYVWRSRQAAAPEEDAMKTAASPSASASAASLAGASPEVQFRITPPDAVLVVDGKELPRERRSLPRPAAGQISSVVIHAKGFDDSSVQVDYFSAPAIDVALTPEKDAGAPVVKKKPKPKEKDPNALPDNPY